MLLRPTLLDFKIIGFYTGRLVLGVGMAKFIPLVVSLLCREWNIAVIFVIGAASCFIVGYLLSIFCRVEKEMNWLRG